MTMTERPPAARHDGDEAAEQQHDEDREELRQRYYGLLQELRVVLPGVQVMLAFLLTVPFANRFVELDDLGQDLYGLSLLTAALSVVVLITPTALHRFGDRHQRRMRLRLAVASTRVGLALLAVSIVSAVVVVTRLVFGDTVSGWSAALVGGTIVVAWIGLPALLHWEGDDEEGDDGRVRASAGGATPPGNPGDGAA